MICVPGTRICEHLWTFVNICVPGTPIPSTLPTVGVAVVSHEKLAKTIFAVCQAVGLSPQPRTLIGRHCVNECAIVC